MRIAVASDHAGFALKQRALEVVRQAGYDPIDLGSSSTEPVDYPDVAEKLGRALQNEEAERGILICGSGVGAAIAANKMRGIRAGLCHDTYSARQSVEHDDANVLALGARVIGEELAVELIQTFLQARFNGEPRHVRRIGKVLALERRETGRGSG
ncbi:MAG TPA: ribose 5-phosphate isomerase B [Anaerolineales bacterium]|nr:ribose 5-phosphate isomerase B [Anaerolineales bacterium]